MSDGITLDVAIARLDELDDANEERQSDGEMAATFLGKRLRDSLDPFHRDWEAVKDGIESLRDELAECRAAWLREEEAHRANVRGMDETISDLRAKLAQAEQELAAIKRPCTLRRGHEIEDLEAHGETVICSTMLMADLFETRAESQRERDEAIATLMRERAAASELLLEAKNATRKACAHLCREYVYRYGLKGQSEKVIRQLAHEIKWGVAGKPIARGGQHD